MFPSEHCDSEKNTQHMYATMSSRSNVATKHSALSESSTTDDDKQMKEEHICLRAGRKNPEQKIKTSKARKYTLTSVRAPPATAPPPDTRDPKIGSGTV